MAKADYFVWKDEKTGLAITFSFNLEEGGQSSPLADGASPTFNSLRKQYSWGAREASNEPEGVDNGCFGGRCYQQDFFGNSFFECA